MKKALKYTLATLAAASLAAPVYAGGTIVDKVAVSVAATYTEASNNGLHIGDAQVSPGGWRPLFLEPDHEWDYALGLTYRVGANTRLFLEYDHFNGDEDRTATNISALGQPAVLNSPVAANVEHKDHDFKFGLRHTLEFSPYYEMTFGGGLEYAKIQRTFTVAYPGAAAPRARTTYDETEGWGPYVDGLARAYPWGNANRCWSIWAHAGIGLLYSEHTGYSRLTDTVGLDVNPTYLPEETKSTVARFEADLGVEWHRVMRADFADMRLGVRLGLRHMNYINGFKNGNLFQAPTAGGAGGLELVNTSPDDYGRTGAFLQFTLGGVHS